MTINYTKEQVKELIPKIRRDYILAFHMLSRRRATKFSIDRNLNDFYSKYHTIIKNIKSQYELPRIDNLAIEFTDESGLSFYRANMDQPNELRVGNRNRNYNREFLINLAKRRFTLDELPQLGRDLSDLFQKAHVRMNFISQMITKEMEELYAKSFLEFYDQLNDLGVIMLDEDKVEITIKDHEYFRWSYQHPTSVVKVEYASGGNGYSQKIWLKDIEG